MRSDELFAFIMAVSSVLGAVVPKVATQGEVRAHEEFAELEARGFHASCIIGMSSCLGEFGLLDFKYQETKIADKYMHPWQLANAILAGACQDGNGAMNSEPGQMFDWHKKHDLVEHSMCSEIDCEIGDDSPCDSLACGPCFAPAVPPGPMPPPPAKPRCGE